MKETFRKRRIDTIFVMVVFCVFAISVLMVLMLGASIYRNVTEVSRESQCERTAFAYIWSKVKNNDNADTIFVGEFDGHSALFFYERIGDRLFRTAIYHHDGWVTELFADPELGLGPDAGVRIMRLDDLSFDELEFGLIRVISGSRSLLLSSRGTYNLAD